MGKNKNKCCLIYNFPQHYREAIFLEMDKMIGFDFYFGDYLDWAPDVKDFDVRKLEGFKGRVRNVRILFKHFIWQKNTVSLVFKNYEHYVLYGDPAYLSNWVIMILCRLLGKKTYLWTHGFNKGLSWKGKLFNYPFYYLSNKVLLYSDFSRKVMIEKGITEKKMVCIYNSLDYNLQLQIRKNLTKTNVYSEHFQNNYPVLIYIGRIQKAKKIDLIFEAMVLLKAKGILCNFVVVGGDKEEVKLDEIAINTGLEDNTWLFGPCYDEKIIGELLYNSDVCISPGDIGLTAIHSLTYGTPVLTHSDFENQGPEFEAIQPGISGDFFMKDNTEDLGKKIENWISANEIERNKTRNLAYKIVDEKYNPGYQIRVMKEALNIN